MAETSRRYLNVYLIFQNIPSLKAKCSNSPSIKKHGEFIMKIQQIKMFIGLFILAFAAFGSACGIGKETAQNPPNEPKKIRPTETPTPPYKPLKRVSRDVIKTEPKDEAAPVKVKK